MLYKNIIVEKSLDFALEIIDFSEQLEEQKKHIVSNQLLKSGTSIGTCINNVRLSASRADFFGALKVAEKHALETSYWLTLCNKSTHYPSNDTLKKSLDDIQKLLKNTISSQSRNL